MKVSISIFILAALSMTAGCAGEEKRDNPAPEVGFVTVKSQDIPLSVELPGRVTAFEMSEVRPQVSGIIRQRLFTEGTVVQQGQTLYRIDPSPYRAAAAQALANLQSAQAARTAAQALAERYRPLMQMEAVSKQDYTNAVAAAGQAAAAVAQGRAQLEAANINLRYTQVPAPISGRVGRSLATTGALVTSGQADPLTTIQRLDPIYVDIQQSSGEMLALRRSIASGGSLPSSTAVKLVLEDGAAYDAVGTLQFSEAMVDPQSGSVTLRARFANPSGLLLPGMYVRARLSQAIVRNAILVPQAGLSRDPRGNATVMVVRNGPGKAGSAPSGQPDAPLQDTSQNQVHAELRTVKADRTYGAYWIVTSGLKAGERIIVEGLGAIQPGATVRAVPAGSRPGGRAKSLAGAR